MKPTTLTIKPAPGPDGKPLTVRDPVTMLPLAAEGEVKPRDTYWLRRFKGGDVVETTLKPAKAAKE